MYSRIVNTNVLNPLSKSVSEEKEVLITDRLITIVNNDNTAENANTKIKC